LGDLKEARKMKIDSLAVLYGFHNKDTLLKGNPSGFINKPQDIFLKIDKYWKEQ